MKKILVVDFLTKKEAKKALKKYDEIWYIYKQNAPFDDKIKCIIDYHCENPTYWEKEVLALDLCNRSYTKRLDKRLNALHKNWHNIELIHKKYQASRITDFHHASIIKLFIDELINKNQNITITYKNNQFLYSHDFPEQIKLIRKLRIETVFKKLIHLILHFGYYMYNLLAAKHNNEKSDFHKDYDILFYFDRKGQEREWEFILQNIPENKKCAILYCTRPLMQSLSDSDLKDILDVIKNTRINGNDVYIDKQFNFLNFREIIHYLFEGFIGFLSILYYLHNDFKDIEWYMKYFLIEGNAIKYKKIIEKINTKRFITIGEYQPDLNVRTTLWKSSGAKTENVVHGLKQAIFEDSYVYLDRMYVWGGVMENEFRNMNCSVGEYIYSGPKYLYKVFDNGQKSETKKTIGIFSNDIEQVGSVDSWGVGNLLHHKKRFFEYVCAAAKKNTQYDFIIYPHPRERERGYVIKDFDSQMTKIPNLTIDFEKNRMGSFKHIISLDLGITMQSSIGFEMLFAGFKCIFFDTAPELLHNYKSHYGDIFTNPDVYPIDKWSDFVGEKALQSKESFFRQYNVQTFDKYSLINSIFNE